MWIDEKTVYIPHHKHGMSGGGGGGGGGEGAGEKGLGLERVGGGYKIF